MSIHKNIEGGKEDSKLLTSKAGIQVMSKSRRALVTRFLLPWPGSGGGLAVVKSMIGLGKVCSTGGVLEGKRRHHMHHTDSTCIYKPIAQNPEGKHTADPSTSSANNPFFLCFQVTQVTQMVSQSTPLDHIFGEFLEFVHGSRCTGGSIFWITTLHLPLSRGM